MSNSNLILPYALEYSIPPEKNDCRLVKEETPIDAFYTRQVTFVPKRSVCKKCCVLPQSSLRWSRRFNTWQRCCVAVTVAALTHEPRTAWPPCLAPGWSQHTLTPPDIVNSLSEGCVPCGVHVFRSPNIHKSLWTQRPEAARHGAPFPDKASSCQSSRGVARKMLWTPHGSILVGC